MYLTFIYIVKPIQIINLLELTNFNLYLVSSISFVALK